MLLIVNFFGYVVHLHDPHEPVALQDPDSNKEEEYPRDTIEGDVGQEEVGVDAGGPEKVCPLHAHQYICQSFHFKVHQGEQ